MSPVNQGPTIWEGQNFDVLGKKRGKKEGQKKVGT